MTRLSLILLGLICFSGFVIASAPARLAFDLALRPAGVEAGLVQGLVWDARLARVRAGNQTIASARAELDPLSLAALNARFDVTLSDPELRADGFAVLHPGGVRIEDASGVVRLSRVLPALAAFAPEESARFEIARLALDDQGRCLSAEGRVSSTALIALGERYGAAMPALGGELLCAGESVGLQLSGASEGLSIDGRIRFGVGGPEGRIEARATESAIVAALSFAGFDQVGQGVYALSLPAEEEG